MGVASHLRIELEEYDRSIRTFVPHYETMLRATAEVLTLIDTPEPVVVDLGVGTGALTEACLAVRPEARMIGLDADGDMLRMAEARLAGHANVELRRGDFLEGRLPHADAIVACIALHHVRDPEVKKDFYRAASEALRPGGILGSGDCFPAAEPRLAERHREAWLRHLERTCTRPEAEGYLEAWSGEDRYFPLERELSWLREAGLAAEVLWRTDGFAVMAGLRTG